MPPDDRRVGSDRRGEDDLRVHRVQRRRAELVVEHLVVGQRVELHPARPERGELGDLRDLQRHQVVDQLGRVRVGGVAHPELPRHRAHRRRHHRDLELTGHVRGHVRGLDGGQVVLLEYLGRGRRHHEVGLFRRRDLAARQVPGDRRGLHLAHPADRLEDAGHPVRPAHLAVGEDPHSRRPLQLDVLHGGTVFRRPQLTLGEVACLVLGAGGKQPGLPQQAANVLGVNIRRHDFRLLRAAVPQIADLPSNVRRALPRNRPGHKTPPAVSAPAHDPRPRSGPRPARTAVRRTRSTRASPSR